MKSVDNYRDLYGDAADFLIEYQKKHKGVLPWKRTFSNMKARCENKKCISYRSYGEKGIRVAMTVADVRYLYLRDRAWKLRRASIDRIDPKGNYTLDNCRFIEMLENTRRRLPTTAPIFKKPGEAIEPGLCRRCGGPIKEGSMRKSFCSFRHYTDYYNRLYREKMKAAEPPTKF